MRSSIAASACLVLALMVSAAPALYGQESTAPNPGRAIALMKQADERIAAGDFAGALTLLARARQEAPTIARIPFMMATCEYNQSLRAGNPVAPERAWKLLDEAISLDPDWGEPHFFAGVMSFSAESYENAARAFSAALARSYLPKQSRVNLAISLFRWGVLLSEEDRPEEDRAIGIRVFTDSVDRFAALKDDLRFSRKDRDSFSEHWVNSLVNLVALYQRSELYPEAEKILLGLIEIQPNYYLHHYNLGLVLGGTMKNWDRALTHYRRALELCDDPDWIEPYPMIG